MLKEVYNDGFKSYRLNKGKLINPYPSGSDEFDRFEAGWTQAQKRSQGGFMFLDVDPDTENAGHTMAERYRDMGKTSQPRTKPYKYMSKFGDR